MTTNAAAGALPENCLQAILARLEVCRSVTVLEELKEGGPVTAKGGELLALVATVRAHIRSAGVKPGDRCALLAENGIRWVAANLAIFAEGLICVPLYSRQAPEELAAMIADCEPALLLCGTAALRDARAKLATGCRSASCSMKSSRRRLLHLANSIPRSVLLQQPR